MHRLTSRNSIAQKQYWCRFLFIVHTEHGNILLLENIDRNWTHCIRCIFYEFVEKWFHIYMICMVPWIYHSKMFHLNGPINIISALSFPLFWKNKSDSFDWNSAPFLWEFQLFLKKNINIYWMFMSHLHYKKIIKMRFS